MDDTVCDGTRRMPVAALAMVFQLVGSTPARRHEITAPHLGALVCAGARFEHGRLVEGSEAKAV